MPRRDFRDWLMGRLPLALATATLLAGSAFAAERDGLPASGVWLVFWLVLPLALALGFLAAAFLVETPWRHPSDLSADTRGE